MDIRPEDNRFIEEVLEREEYDFLYHYPTVVDIGANIGTFSIWIYDHADRIYAIEPAKENVKYLQDNVKRNRLDKIRVFELAISNSNHVKKMNEIGPAGGGGWQISEAGTYPVRCQTIKRFMQDALLDYVDLLKIDVEGHELEVFSDPHFPQDAIGTIIGETHNDNSAEIEALLTNKGYLYSQLNNRFIARK